MNSYEDETPNKEDKPKNSWMIRECYMYNEEYNDCTSFRSRFQQYFVFGHFEDCSQWKHDHYNCRKWKDNKDKAAAEAVIASEESRRHKRLDAHYNNPVWENRKEPPPNWNAPLPPFLAERLKGSYLEQRAQELREGKETIRSKQSFCVIM